MKKTLAILLALVMLSMPGFSIHAQGSAENNVQFNDVSVFFEFGKEVIFQATLSNLEEIDEIILYIEPQGNGLRSETVTANENGEIIVTYNAATSPLRPFAMTDYWFEATLKDGSRIESETFSFLYEDDRFEWQRLEKNGFQINWQTESSTFGETVLSVAEQSLEVSRNFVAAEPPPLLKIYVYENASDVQTALNLGQYKSWVAGHASPDLATVLVSVPEGPSQKLELERQIPHEITHILQYQLMGASYRNAPMWLLEGTASLAELYPNPDYERVLQRAVEEESLIPLEELCATFPGEASRAFLAYAQSESFTRYIYNRYGSTGLKSLMENYQNGLGCTDGFSASFKRSLTQEEYRWHQTLGMDTGMLIVENVAPYLIMLGLLGVPVALSTIRPKTDETRGDTDDDRNA